MRNIPTQKKTKKEKQREKATKTHTTKSVGDLYYGGVICFLIPGVGDLH